MDMLDAKIGHINKLHRLAFDMKLAEMKEEEEAKKQGKEDTYQANKAMGHLQDLMEEEI